MARFHALIVSFVIAVLLLQSTITMEYSGFVEQPQFSFVETDDILVKYNDSVVGGVRKQLHVCCAGNKGAPQVIAKILCKRHTNCSKGYQEIETCKSHGKTVWCYIKYVMSNTMFKGYLLLTDNQNHTVKSKVATYVTSQLVKIPRPVSNVTSLARPDGGLQLSWSPSTVFMRTQEYSQLVCCQPVTHKNSAKAICKAIDFDRNAFVIHPSNLTALTKYRCCVQVENDETSKFSEPACVTLLSSEQAPSSAPLITCGNQTRPCSYVKLELHRNVTITFELPKPSARNGEIIRSIFTYHNTSLSNTTTSSTPQVSVLINGSATSFTLTLRNDQSYVISGRSCTRGGCSPLSNAIVISALPRYKEDIFPLDIVAGITVTVFVLIVALLTIFVCYRRKIKEDRLSKLPALGLNYPEYHNTGGVADEIYDTLAKETSLMGNGEAHVSSAENLAFNFVDT